MIPKKIHYCWLSDDKYPILVEKCIMSWHKVLPDYEFILWDRKRFDIESHPWCKAAFELKKYAFVSDYIRFYALFTEGGIYLDSDVEVLKTFNALLHYKSFIGFESCSGMIEPALMGAEQNQIWCKRVLDIYDEITFPTDRLPYEFIAPKVSTNVLKNMYNNFPINTPDNPILLDDDLLLCPPDWFSPLKESSKMVLGNRYKLDITNNTYSIHHFNGSWTNHRKIVKILRSVGVYKYVLRIWKTINRH